MKKLDLGQTIGILANVGVIAGIVFLGIELRQNNQLLQAEAIGTVLDTRMVRQDQQLENPELVALVVKNNRGEPLTEEEQATINALHARSVMGWQKDYLLFQAGILDEEYLRANLALMKRAFGRRGQTLSHLEHWENNWREVATEDYREFIEQCIISDCDTIPR